MKQLSKNTFDVMIVLKDDCINMGGEQIEYTKGFEVHKRA
jgi:hypothetical protein